MSDTDSPRLYSLRDAMKMTAMGGFATALGLKSDARAQAVETPVSATLKQHMDAQWLDQYAKPFDLNSVAGKPYILLFGFKGCEYCSMITQNLAKLRAQGAAVQDVPVVLVNVTPNTDRNSQKEYVSNYYENGICQTLEEAKKITDIPQGAERTMAAQAAFDTDVAIDAKDRKFHLVFPPSNKAAQALQESLGVTRNPEDEQSHNLYMALVDGSGKCIVSKFAATDDPAECRDLVTSMTSAISTFTPASKSVK